jgi:hypothetical protein
MNRYKTRELSPGERAAWQHSLPQVDSTVVHELIALVKSYLHGTAWQPSSSANPSLLQQYAREHGIAGLIGAVANHGSLPFKHLNNFGSENYIANLIKHERIILTLLPVAQLCRQLGIRYCVVKGPALADTVYSDGGIRSYGDIDVLVEGKESLKTLLQQSYFQENGARVKYNPKSVKHPGRMHVNLSGSSENFEFFFPMESICDPMFDFLAHYGKSMLDDVTGEKYAIPPATPHFIFILLHMEKHLGIRLIWHLDIMAFHKKCKDIIDMDLVCHEVKRLQLTQLTHCMTEFYAKYFDYYIDIVAPRKYRGYNTVIAQKIASPEQLHGNVAANNIKKHPVSTGVLVAIRFFLITDPENQFPLSSSKGARWVGALLHLKIGGNRNRVVDLLARSMLLIKPFLWPVLRTFILRLYRINRIK